MKFRHLLILSSLLGLAQASAEDFDSFPKKAVPVDPVMDATPLDAAVLESAIKKGVDHLLDTQNANGSWGNATKTKKLNIYAPIPGAHHGYRMGTTGLALCGLIESKDSRPEVLAAIAKGEEWMITALPRLKRAGGTSIYNNWGHAYGLRALVALAKMPGASEAQIEKYKELAEGQIKSLSLYQDLDGGWGYLSTDGGFTARPNGGSMSFMTSTVLLGLKEAQETFGVSLEPISIERAISSVVRQRSPDFSYLYATSHWKSPRYKINRPAGSLARTPVCNAALRVWGDALITDKVITVNLDRLIKRNGWLDIARKRPKPHDIHFSISGYFYFYGHYYASECIGFLPKNEQGQWKNKLARVIIDKQESDGSWWDYPLYDYHQAYGTGYALVTLSRCRL